MKKKHFVAEPYLIITYHIALYIDFETHLFFSEKPGKGNTESQPITRPVENKMRASK